MHGGLQVDYRSYRIVYEIVPAFFPPLCFQDLCFVVLVSVWDQHTLSIAEWAPVPWHPKEMSPSFAALRPFARGTWLEATLGFACDCWPWDAVQSCLSVLAPSADGVPALNGYDGEDIKST